MCGNLAHADPASELPAVMLALAARLRALSVRGERWIAAADFFRDLSTALAPDEMLMEVELPVAPPRSGACFMEVARRRGDFAIIGVACTVELDATDAAATRIGLCNAGDGRSSPRRRASRWPAARSPPPRSMRPPR